MVYNGITIEEYVNNVLTGSDDIIAPTTEHYKAAWNALCNKIKETSSHVDKIELIRRRRNLTRVQPEFILPYNPLRE